MDTIATDHLAIIYKAAEEYKNILLNQQYLFIGRNTNTGEYSYFEVFFEDKHFMHLTGLKGKGMNSSRFFELCLAKRINPKDIEGLHTGESKLKADVMIQLMRLPYTAKMMGDYNGHGNFLYSEKFAGSTTGCMGFVYDSDIQLHVANTLLKADIRECTNGVKQICAVYRKKSDEALYPYTPITCSKNLRGKDLSWPEPIGSKIEKTPPQQAQ